MPTNLHCDNITDRLTLVSKHDSSVGELEIQATANMLLRTIIVVNKQFDNINVYNDLYNRHIDNCITLRFLQLGEYVGHYEAILPDDACRVSVNKCTKPHDIISVPRKSSTIQIRKRRSQVASLLTSSPYKAKLEAAATQKNTSTKPSRNRRPKQSNKCRKRCISDDVSNCMVLHLMQRGTL